MNICNVKVIKKLFSFGCIFLTQKKNWICDAYIQHVNTLIPDKRGGNNCLVTNFSYLCIKI
jgi:hypothetical protein